MKYIITIFLSLFLTACNVTVPVEIAAETITTSADIDKAQAELGQYADSSTMAELDTLQAEIEAALKTGQGVLDVNDYYDRAVKLYLKISAEAAARSDEMTEQQKQMLLELDARLIDLNANIIQLKAENPTGVLVLEALGDVATILKFYALL